MHNCFVASNGADGDHRTVRMELNLTSLKYKEKASLNTGEIDWRKICKEDEQHKLYNKYLLDFTTRDMTYDNFCEAVVRAGQETNILLKINVRDGTQQAKLSLLQPLRKRTDYATNLKKETASPPQKLINSNSY